MAEIIDVDAMNDDVVDIDSEYVKKLEHSLQEHRASLLEHRERIISQNKRFEHLKAKVLEMLHFSEQTEQIVLYELNVKEEMLKKKDMMIQHLVNKVRILEGVADDANSQAALDPVHLE
jgi:hypothetical protein